MDNEYCDDDDDDDQKGEKDEEEVMMEKFKNFFFHKHTHITKREKERNNCRWISDYTIWLSKKKTKPRLVIILFIF